MRQDSLPQNSRVLFCAQNFELHNQGTINDCCPTRLSDKLSDIEASLFTQLASDTLLEIDCVTDNVIGIRRPTGKIDFSGIERALA